MLSRENRLKKNKEFNYIYKKGKYINSSNFLICYVDSYLKFPKFGFSVNKKIGNSVMRSRAKRLMSEVVRLNINKITNKNYVVVVKPSILNCEFKELEKEFLNVIQKANLIKKDLNE